MRTFLVTLCITFAAQAASAEVIMRCTGTKFGYDFDRTYKYAASVFSDKKIFIREDGAWVPWCVLEKPWEGTMHLRVSDKGAKCARNTYRTNNNEVVVNKSEIVLDFILLKNTYTFDEFLRNGKNELPNGSKVTDFDLYCEKLE